MANIAELSEKELISKFRDKELSESEFFSELVERYYPALVELGRRFLLQRGINEIEVEDLVQSTFIDVLAIVRRHDLKSSLRTWLFNTFRSKASHELTQKKVSDYVYLDEFGPDEDRLNNPAAKPSMIEESIYFEELYNALPLKLILSGLSTEENKLLMLHYVEDMTIKEIAVALHEETPKIKYDLNRLRAKLRYRVRKFVEGSSIFPKDQRLLP
jgi:RNA polymerase sigma factor (sigma-70 family)